jgi:SAM-dependent methyltransferase
MTEVATLSPGENVDQTVTLLHVREIDRYNSWVLAYLRPFLAGRILEFGCGIGTYSALIRRAGKSMCCVDMEARYVQHVRRAFRADPHVSVVLGALPDDIEFRSGSFDTIVCLNVLEHIAQVGDALGKVVSWLSPGGILFVQVPAHQWLFGTIDLALGHQRRYASRDIEEMLKEAGLEMALAPRYLYTLAIPGWWLYGRILRRRTVPETSVRVANALAGLSRCLEGVIRAPAGLTIVAAGRARKRQ